jgi:hypothetical protein
VTACLCNAGFGGPPGGPCALCAAGTYELGDACLACPANSDSVQGSVGATACLCRPGYFGLPGGPCRPCPHGTFSAANSIVCAACGPNANTSATASTSSEACLCRPGHTRTAAACSACAANTYKPTLSNASCTACTQHSTSPLGSTSSDACGCLLNFLKHAGNGTCARVCAAGFEAGGANLADCVGCRPGFYKTLEGDHACTPCPPNAFSLLANQTSISSCMCQHGYIWNAATKLCDVCPPGTFNNRANESRCFVCVSSIATSSSTACTGLELAPAGYQVTSSGANLESCPVNTYNNGSAKACTACPWPQTFSPATGLTSVSQCACRPGHERLATGVCTACALGNYKNTTGDAACAACAAVLGPHSTTLQPAAANASACVCKPGFALVNGACTLTTCPPGASLVITESFAACRCSPGFAHVANLPNGSVVCTACANGLFKDLIGNAACTSCGVNTVSLAPRANRTACACAPDYEAGENHGPDVLGGSCVAQCAPGYHGAAGNCAKRAPRRARPRQRHRHRRAHQFHAPLAHASPGRAGA